MIDVGLSTQVTHMLTAPDMVIPIPPGVLTAVTTNLACFTLLSEQLY